MDTAFVNAIAGLSVIIVSGLIYIGIEKLLARRKNKCQTTYPNNN